MTDSFSDHGSAQREVNTRVWSAGRYVKAYDHAILRPAEVVLLARYREALSGRVLDVGCGAGRLLGYLLLLGSDVQGIDISPRMVKRCGERYPDVDVRVGDMTRLGEVAHGSYDAILVSDNLIDVLDDAQRRRVLADVRGRLAPRGLVIFSSHNLDSWDRAGTRRGERLGSSIRAAAERSPFGWMRWAAGSAISRRNRRRLGPMQHRAADHAVVNDTAHHHGLLHYYIGHAQQERQLSDVGLALVEALEDDGRTVPRAEAGRSAWLYYVARPAG